MSKNEDGEDWTGPFVDELIREKFGGFVTGYALFISYIDEQGRVCYWGDTMEGQSAMTSIGIAETMQEIEKYRVVAHHFGLSDHEDGS